MSDPLAARLRGLRQSHWGTSVTQPALGRALGVKPPTVSSWERPETPAVPTADRLAQYAAFFATRRSLDEGRLLRDEELTPAERSERDDLFADLLRLRETALGTTADPGAEPDPWRFTDRAPVRIICGQLAERPSHASGSDPNYMALSAFADQDALVELYGHLRARNPESDVRFELAGRLEDDDLNAHLVLLGNLARTQTDLRYWLPDGFPVRQVPEEGIADGEVFEVGGAGGRRFRPTLARRDGALRVVEDIGFLARTPSPLDSSRTLTLCSGVFTRGVYGAVRSLTDPGQRTDNARYLRERFAGATTFGLLVRVRVSDHAIGTPKLDDEQVRLHEFPQP